MTRQLRLHPDALREFNDAVDYYERESPGLSSVFIDEVEAGFARIRHYPQAAPGVAPNGQKLVWRVFLTRSSTSSATTSSGSWQ